MFTAPTFPKLIGRIFSLIPLLLSMALQPHAALAQEEVTHLDGFEISPEIISSPILTAYEGIPYHYQVEIRNLDSFPVQYFLETAPAGMTIDPETGLLEWAAPLLGIYPIEVVVIDSRGRLDLQIYDLAVEPDPSEGFEIVSEPEAQTLQNSFYQYQVEVAGETEGVQYSLTISPAGMTIDAGTGLIGWIADAVGSASVSINVTNALGQTAAQQYDLEVVEREPGELVQGQLAGLHDGELVVQELNGGQHFVLTEDGHFSWSPFITGGSYQVEISSLSTSNQNCVLSNEQGLLPQEIGNELLIQCAAGDVTAEDLLESIDELEATGELTPVDEILDSEFAANQQPEARSREIDRAHALVLSAEDPDPDWMGTEINGDQVIVTSPGSAHTVSGSKFNADGEITGPIDASKLRFEIRLQRSADDIQWVPRELVEDMVFWTENPGEFQVHVPADLEHGRLIVGLRPDFEDPGARAIAERWSQAVIFEIWPVRPGVIELESSSVVFPQSGENPMGPGSEFSIDELEQYVDAEFANDNLVMPLIVESGSLLQVGDLIDHQWNGDPYGGRILYTESRSGQTLLLLSPEWNAVYDVMEVEDSFLEKHGVLPSVIAYRIGDEVIPDFDEQYRDPIESSVENAGAQPGQSPPADPRNTSGASHSSRSAGSDLFIRTCSTPTSRPVVAVSNKFKLSPPEASVSLTVATGERASTLDIDCSWQANPNKRFAMPLVVAGPVGIIAQKLFGTEVGVRPTGKVVLDARADVSALLAFKASFSTKDGMKTNMPELPRTSLALDSLDGPPIQLSNRIGSDLGVTFFANALSTRGLLGKLARLFSSDEIEIGVEASVSLGIGLGFSGANAAAVYQGADSKVFSDLKFCAKVGISASLLKLMRTIIGDITVDVELFCTTLKAAIGPPDPFTFAQVQDDFEGNAIATGLTAGPVLELVFGKDSTGIVASSDRGLFESIFDDRHDAISYDLAECPARNSSAGGGASADRITGDLIVCAHTLVCGKADKPVELCGTGLAVSPVTASGFTGEQVSVDGKIKALSPRGLLEAIEVDVSGGPLSPQVSPLQPLTLSSTRPERTLSLESQCEAQGITRGQTEIQAFVDNIEPGQASNIRVCRCEPGEQDCDRIWGSPHLLTADGLALDYYASGDYVLARVDGNQPIEVQGRFLPGYDVSWPQAVALRVGFDIVEVHTETFEANGRVSHRLRIWVNGTEPVEPGKWQPFVSTRILRLPGGGLIVLEAMINRFRGVVSDPSRILVLMPADHEFPDFGVRVKGLIFGQSAETDFRDTPPILSISLLRGESTLGQDTGLLGGKDGDETNDLKLRSGSVVDFSDNLTWTELYAQFGASWLVRPYECLFRNGCLDPKFPKQPTIVDPERRQFAEAACFGLEGWYREACIHDVGLSGSIELVQGLYQNTDELNFMANRIKRPGTDFPFLTLTPGASEPLDSYELHHFTVERVEGQGPYMVTIRPPKNTTAVIHSTGAGNLTDDGDQLIDAVRVSCIPDPEWAELGVSWPIEGSLELWTLDPISGTAGAQLAEMPLPADRLNEYCTSIRFNVNSTFLEDASVLVENIGDEQLQVKIRPEPGVTIEASALERVAVCPGCQLPLDLGMQCHGGLQKLGAMDITDSAGILLESREMICTTPAGTAFPQVSLNEISNENVLYISPDNRIWDLVKIQTYFFGPQPDLYWNGKPTPLAQDAFSGNEIFQVVSGGSFSGDGHFLALDEFGAVWVWGNNSRGQLGIPSCNIGDQGACIHGQSTADSDTYETPVILGPDRLPVPIKQISAGRDHSLALDINGNVWSWGNNFRFALGNGGSPSEDRSMPSTITGLPPQIDLVSSGGRTGFARTVDGRLFSWGNNWRGALGTGSTQESSPYPAQIQFPETAELPVGVYPYASGAIVVDSAGQLWGWGSNATKNISHLDPRLAIRSPIRIVSQEGNSLRYQWAMSNGSASYAMGFNGRLWAWGRNYSGGLGQGDFEEREGHFPVDLSRLGHASVSAGDAGSGAVMLEDTEGRIWGWGNGYLMPNGFRSDESLPVLIQDLPDARPEVEISSFATGERLFYGSSRLETIAVVELLHQARRLQETRQISISTPGLTFALSGTNELELARDRRVRESILADSQVICETPGLVSTAFDILDEDNEILASHTVEVACQYPVQFRLSKGLDQSEIFVQSDWQGDLDIRIAAVDGLSHEIVQEYVETICPRCEATILIDQFCPVIGRHLLARIDINSAETQFSDLREIDCGRTTSLIRALEFSTFITDHLGNLFGWGQKPQLGLGDPEVLPLDIVEAPVEFERGESFGGGMGEANSSPNQMFFIRRAQARDLDGRLWVWGLEDEGDTGTGVHRLTHDDSELMLESPQPIGGALTDAWITSVGSTLAGALDRRGRTWQWGRNRSGKNGNRVPSDQVLPMSVDAPVPMRVLFAGEQMYGRYSLAVSSDGQELWVWGDIPIWLADADIFPADSDPCVMEGTGQDNCLPFVLLHNGLERNPIRDVVASDRIVLLLDSLGRLWEWSTETSNESGHPALMDLTALDGGKLVGIDIVRTRDLYVIFGLDEFGTIWAQGRGTDGLTGTGSQDYEIDTFQRVAFPSEAGRIVEMAATSSSVLALDENHCFWAWGTYPFEGAPGNVFPDAVPPFTSIFAPIPVLPEFSSPGCPVASRPAITSLPELDISQGQPYVYQVEIDNPNGFPVEFQLEEAPSEMVIDADSGLLEWLVPEVGTHYVELRAVDTRGLFATQQFELQVEAEP